MDAKTTHKILTAARRQQAEFNLDDDFGPALTQPKKTYNPFDPASKLKKQLGTSCVHLYNFGENGLF